MFIFFAQINDFKTRLFFVQNLKNSVVVKIKKQSFHLGGVSPVLGVAPIIPDLRNQKVSIDFCKVPKMLQILSKFSKQSP